MGVVFTQISFEISKVKPLKTPSGVKQGGTGAASTTLASLQKKQLELVDVLLHPLHLHRNRRFTGSGPRRHGPAVVAKFWEQNCNESNWKAMKAIGKQ